MAVRRDRCLHLTVAVAMVDRFVADELSYFDQKENIRNDVLQFVNESLEQNDQAIVDLNTLDDPTLGLAGMYLAVLGTSAESGDGGEVGRGNAVNGLISLNRSTSNEAAAGKNTKCHVGNIYNHLTHRIAGEIVDKIEPVSEAYVWLCSQIGRPIDDPWATSVRVTLLSGVAPNDVKDDVDSIVRQHLHHAADSSESSIEAKN